MNKISINAALRTAQNQVGGPQDARTLVRLTLQAR